MQPTQWRWNHKAPPHFAVSHFAWLREHAIITSSLSGSPHSQAGAPSAMVPRASLLTPLATRIGPLPCGVRASGEKAAIGSGCKPLLLPLALGQHSFFPSEFSSLFLFQ
jgi:hypothetical protein